MHIDDKLQEEYIKVDQAFNKIAENDQTMPKMQFAHVVYLTAKASKTVAGAKLTKRSPKTEFILSAVRKDDNWVVSIMVTSDIQNYITNQIVNQLVIYETFIFDTVDRALKFVNDIDAIDIANRLINLNYKRTNGINHVDDNEAYIIPQLVSELQLHAAMSYV